MVNLSMCPRDMKFVVQDLSCCLKKVPAGKTREFQAPDGCKVAVMVCFVLLDEV